MFTIAYFNYKCIENSVSGQSIQSSFKQIGGRELEYHYKGGIQKIIFSFLSQNCNKFTFLYPKVLLLLLASRLSSVKQDRQQKDN